MARDIDEIAGELLNGIIQADPAIRFAGARPGGVLDQLVHAIAWQVAQLEDRVWELRDQRLIDLADIDGLDVLASEYTGKGRCGAIPARGKGHFTKSTGANVTVPAGTRLIGSNGVEYVTLNSAHGGPLDTVTNDVTIEAATSGVAGNASKESITFTALASSELVTGFELTTDLTGGAESETEAQLRARIRLWRAGFRAATGKGLEAIALNIEGVAYAYYDWQEDVLYVSDAQGTADQRETQGSFVLLTNAFGTETRLQLPHRAIAKEVSMPWISVQSPTSPPTFKVIESKLINPWGLLLLAEPPPAGWSILCQAYRYYTGIVRKVQDAIDGLDEAFPYGAVPAGTVISVLPARRVSTAVSVQCLVRKGSQDGINNRIRARILDFVNSLAMGEGFYPSQIIDKVMDEDGVLEVKLVTPERGIGVKPNEILRIEEGNVTITVEVR
jgi:uncharacterized phage protein gp47/JayE